LITLSLPILFSIGFIILH